MDNRDKLTIFNFLKIVVYTWLIKPLLILIFMNSLFIYIPCKMIDNRCLNFNIFISMIIVFIMLSFSYCIAYGLWDKYTYKVKTFSEKLYMSTKAELKTMKYDFPDYMKCISYVNSAATYILSKKYFAGFIGIFIDYTILFVIYKPFEGIIQW